ncbi:MAG: addiction module toxin RelE [Bacteroidales bacterium]|nr:MAG: addiction module toxin RelE [Bacteroidales bacterium]
MKYREVITYKDYFEDFFKKQSRKVQDKIIKVLDILETVDRVPATYLKYIEGTNGLFEIRAQFSSDIFRIFCCFDGNRLVVLFSGFQKKTQKTPLKEIAKAVRIMDEYFNDKKESK